MKRLPRVHWFPMMNLDTRRASERLKGAINFKIVPKKGKIAQCAQNIVIEGFAGGREASILTYGRILTRDFRLPMAHEQG